MKQNVHIITYTAVNQWAVYF